MQVIQNILKFLDAQATPPKYLGVFHIIWIALTLVATVALCILWKKEVIKKVNKTVLIISAALLILSLYKQIVLSFDYDASVKFIYNWNYFPWHFLSVPLCIGVFAGATSGNINKHFISYLATFGLIAGVWGMFNPNVFVSTVGLNIYSMLCYGSMIAVSIFLFFTQSVRIEIKTFLRALPVFIMVLGIAISFNEIAYVFSPSHQASMFSISRHCPSDVPLYSSVHNAFLASGNAMTIVEYAICILLYIGLVSACALTPLLVMVLAKKLLTTDFDAEYEKDDALALGIRKSEGLDAEDDSQEIFKFKGKVNSKKNTYMQTYFKNLHTNFGNNNKGSCGYVAAAMLLSYYDTALSDKIVPRQFDAPTISHDNPNFKESPGTRFYQPAFDPATVTYKQYVALINRNKNKYLHENLLSLAIDRHLIDVPKDKQTTEFNFGSTTKDIKHVIERYLKKVAEVKSSEYDIHVKDNVDEINKAKTPEKAKEYSNDIREYVIRKVRKGYPVLLIINDNSGEASHAVIAYEYDKKANKLYCHFGYEEVSKWENYTHLTPEECGYNTYLAALVLDFDERKLSHTHTDNYEVVIGGALFYYCPDGRYTTCDDLVVEFGKHKQDLSIVGVYNDRKYPRDQLTIPETIGSVRITNLGKYAFENQEHIKRVVISCNIPEIPKKAFEDCEALKTVVIPESVKKFGKEAFGECPALTTIMYLGTKEQWHKIKKHTSWDRKTGMYKVYCVDGILPKIHARGEGELI